MANARPGHRPHREIAGFASSACVPAQMTASVVAVLTVPLFDGRLLRQREHASGGDGRVHRAGGVQAAIARWIVHFAALRE
jgi:hypothetical protein